MPPNLDLSRLDRDAAVELGRRHFRDFTRVVAPPTYVWNWHHDLMQRKLNDFAWGRIARLIIEAPPGHGKSEDTSRNLPAYCFGINPECRVIASSYTQDLSSAMNRDVQRVMDSDVYRDMFPATALGSENVRSLSGKPRRNTDVFDIPGRRGYYKSAGVGVGIGGWRFDRGIIDDPIKDREEANSPTHRERLWRWFTSVFHKRQAKDAGILITSTRWHEDDLVGRIKKKMASGDIEPYEVVTLPALAELGQSRHPDDPRPDGEALWPWLRSTEQLEMMKRTEPRDFAALEQQDPRGEGGTEWPANYFPDSMWFHVWPSDIVLRIVWYDGAGSPRSRIGDWHAAALLAITADGHLWYDMRLWRGPQEKAAAMLIEITKDFAPDMAGVEANFGQDTMATLLHYAAREEKRPDLAGKWQGFFVHANKELRIRRLGSYLAQGLIHIRENAGGRETLRQMEQFPGCNHDDGPDAMESALQFAGKIIAPAR